MPDIARIIGAEVLREAPTADRIRFLLYDSRRVQDGAASLFFAIAGAQGDGHHHLRDAWARGVRQFVLSRPVDLSELPGAGLLLVPDTVVALQQLAIHHRRQFNLPVIGITGSNGKTIVKEWLHQLLQEDFRIVRSPRSYNSQIGVPLSVWGIEAEHTLGIFEAGISRPGEMERLAQVIRPTIGVLTALGAAHDEGFADTEEKRQEKLKLFAEAEVLVGPQALLQDAWPGKPRLTWGEEEGADLRILDNHISTDRKGSLLRARFRGHELSFALPFTDPASIQNALTCCCVLLQLGVGADTLESRLARLHPVDMRMQLVRGTNDCLLINDSYSADPTSLALALHFLQQQATGQLRTVILSDFVESGRPPEALYEGIAHLLLQYGIGKVVAVGTEIGHHLPRYLQGDPLFFAYPTTEAFLKDFRPEAFRQELILVKGARRFGFERVAAAFQKKLHGTALEIDLNAVAHNLKEYSKLLRPGTKVMAMVKAFSYGSGGAEIASVLQYHNVDFLGVAYADEGVELVNGGIRLPIMVMNAEAASFAAITEYGLEPVLYSFPLLRQFEEHLQAEGRTGYPVHLEIETGMNRLGFAPAEVEALAGLLAASGRFRVRSVFTHLAASEEPAQDEFTRLQAERFRQAADVLQAVLPHPFLRHVANSAAILRHPHLHLDLVRLGIGLYGVEHVPDPRLQLQAVATLRSTIAQVKHLKAGESVSYNRRAVVDRDSVIATVRIGYADGYARRLGHGAGRMWVLGRLAPVIGTVCMDMTMIDVTDIPGIEVGEEVVVFGPQLPVQDLAAWAGTIPYELMTAVSARVKRVYFHD